MKVGPSDSLNIWPWLFLSLLSSEQTGRVRFSSLSTKKSVILHSVLREIICSFESNSDKNQHKFWTWFKHLQFHAKMVYWTEFFKNADEYLSKRWAVCTFEGNKERKLQRTQRRALRYSRCCLILHTSTSWSTFSVDEWATCLWYFSCSVLT